MYRIAIIFPIEASNSTMVGFPQTLADRDRDEVLWRLFDLLSGSSSIRAVMDDNLWQNGKNSGVISCYCHKTTGYNQGGCALMHQKLSKEKPLPFYYPHSVWRVNLFRQFSFWEITNLPWLSSTKELPDEESQSTSRKLELLNSSPRSSSSPKRSPSSHSCSWANWTRCLPNVYEEETNEQIFSTHAIKEKICLY